MTRKEQEFIIKFMQVTFSKLNAALASIYAIKQILIESGVIVPNDLIKKLEEAETLPERLANMSALNQMIEEFNKK